MFVKSLFKFKTDPTVTDNKNIDDYFDAVSESVLNNQE